MNKTIHRLLDVVWPWRAIKRLEACVDIDRRAIHRMSETNAELRLEIEHLTRERDTARRQFAETKTVNLHNAAAHRATEVAMLRQNHQLQAAEARLAGKPVHPELAAAAKDSDFVGERPKYLPVDQPKQVSP